MDNNSARLSSRRNRLWSATGILVILAIAVPLFALSGTAGAGKHRISTTDQFLKAIYSPVKLRAPGDPQEIRYDISCLPPDGNVDGPGVCDGGGTVYFRSSTGASAGVPLQVDTGSQVGRYVAAVPSNIWAAPWFTYYAVIRDNSTGRTITVPQGGSSAPQLSFAMSGPTIDLGTHAFGSTRPADARVAAAAWGSGDGQVGLEDGIDTPTGGASFDVDSAGNVYLLDEANSRMLEFSGGVPTAIPLAGSAGVKADLRISDATGTAYLLEVANASSTRSLLRTYTLDGGAIGTSTVADEAAAQIRLSGSTAYVSEYPSSMWAPVMQNNGRSPVDASAQFLRASPGAPGLDGSNVVVLSTGNEIRIGMYAGGSSAPQLTSVRITSATPVADIQLAQKLPSGNLLVVFSVYTEDQHEYEAVVVDPTGRVVDQFALSAADWAQSMALSRFRLVGWSLYELGSTDSGVFVDRYDLGV